MLLEILREGLTSVAIAQLFLRCYAEKVGNQWQAFCLDLSLAAQGDTFAEVKDKLDAMVAEYAYDALVGEDREYAEQLLTRRAPLRDWLKYYWYWVLHPRSDPLHGSPGRRVKTGTLCGPGPMTEP